MSKPLILTSQTGSVRTLILNRPQSLNSFSSAMLAELLYELDQAATDPEVRCLVIGAAGRAFCAGQDLADALVAPDLTPGAKPKDLGIVIERYYKPLVERVRSMPTPVVAAVNGVAAGAGAALALHCDIVIAATSASFIQAFSKIGLAPDTGASWLLPRLIGRAQTLALMMLGEKLSAVDAERMGLVWKCVDDASLQEETASLAQKLSTLPTKALVATRQAVDSAMNVPLDIALRAEGALQRELGYAPDYNEGVAAFLGKRTPKFTDR